MSSSLALLPRYLQDVLHNLKFCVLKSFANEIFWHGALNLSGFQHSHKLTKNQLQFVPVGPVSVPASPNFSNCVFTWKMAITFQNGQKEPLASTIVSYFLNLHSLDPRRSSLDLLNQFVYFKPVLTSFGCLRLNHLAIPIVYRPPFLLQTKLLIL